MQILQTTQEVKPKKKPGRKPKVSTQPTSPAPAQKPQIKLFANGKKEYDWKKELVCYDWKTTITIDEQKIGAVVKTLLNWDELFDYLLKNSKDFMVWVNCFDIVSHTINCDTKAFDWLIPFKEIFGKGQVHGSIFVEICKTKPKEPYQFIFVENPIETKEGNVTLTEIGFRNVLFHISKFLEQGIPNIAYCY
jgi:hypothetical protein